MAIFSPQLIYTIIIFAILSKVGKFYSLGRYLLCNKLHRYVSPDSKELKKTINNHFKNNSKKKTSRFDIDDEKEEFYIPENVSISLGVAQVRAYDLFYIKFAADFQSFVDVSLISLIIYSTTEIYYAFFHSSDEINLSVLWCLAIIFYGVASLSTITFNYLRTDEGALCVVFAGLSFIVSLLVQFSDTKLFDLNLKQAYEVARTSAQKFLEANSNASNLTTNGSTPSKLEQLTTYTHNDILFSCIIATISSFIGGLLFFPSFRLAKLHLISLRYCADSKLKRFILYLNFIFPLLLTLCWFKYSTFDTKSNKLTKFIENNPFISSLLQQNIRLYLIIAFFILRLALYNRYAQSYLNIAYEQAVYIRKKTAKCTNIQFQNAINGIYQYYGVIANQYIIPIFIVLFLTLLMKTLGELDWCSLNVCNQVVDTVRNITVFNSNHTHYNRVTPQLFKQLEASTFNITASYNAFKQIFSSFVLKTIVGYFTFWTCTIGFLISSFGLFYYQYIDRVVILDNNNANDESNSGTNNEEKSKTN